MSPPPARPAGFTLVDDDGVVLCGQDAIQATLRRNAEHRKQRDRFLRALTPLDRYRLERRLANGTAHVSTSHSRPASPVSAPRRVNGSSGRPKAQSSRSSAASGDSGDSD